MLMNVTKFDLDSFCTISQSCEVYTDPLTGFDNDVSVMVQAQVGHQHAVSDQILCPRL